MKTPYIIIGALACALAARADDMVIEVTQDFSVNILENLPDKPYQSPALLPLPAAGAKLSPEMYSADGSVAHLLATLPPAQWPLAVAATPYRGYASLSYAPVLNVGANAGYRFVQSPKASVGAWGQYSLNRYHTGSPRYDIGASRLVLGIDAYSKVKEYGEFDANVSFSRADALHPAEDSWWLASNSFAGCASWHGTPQGNVKYNIGVDLHHTMFSAPDSLGELFEAPAQTLFNARGGVTWFFGEHRDIEYAVDAALHSLTSAKGVDAQTLLDISPNVRIGHGAIKAKVGVAASVGFAGLGVRLAPDAYIAYAPERSRFVASLSFAGGRTLNSVFRIMELNPYLLTNHAYAPTNVPVDATISVAFGRFAGVRLSASARFACARDALMPNMYKDMSGVDINSWLFTVEADYACSNLLTAAIRYSRAAANRLTWYEWLDGADNALVSSLTLTPVQELSITASHTLRTGRHIADMPLRNISNLALSATYAITPRLSATVQANNLLGRRHLLISGYQAQGLTAGAAISYKF